ncbi:MAG TPA: DNA polymerase III subunit beta [Caulobacteraceae bacterium]|jgi:DNA polymerase-3 subunit beta|nr:DNA polymerase III subunit beta [Caulobacteraceae bacterium]
MELSIERAGLLKALGHVQSVVERRNTIPILSNVLLSASPGELAFSATDLDIEITDVCRAEVAAGGQITAPAHMLYEIARELPDGADVSLSFTGDDARLEVRAGRSRFNLPVLPAGDFPVMSADGLSAPIPLDTAALVQLVDKTRFAMSTEETRYYINGLYLHAVVEGGAKKLRAVATDSRRLALAEMASPDGYGDAPGVIIPRKTVIELRRLLDDAGETVTLEVSQQKLRFVCGGAALTSKVIDGSFPPYERVIPRGNTRLMTLDSQLFGAAVRRVAIVSAEQSRPVTLLIENGRMTLTVRNMDAGQAVEQLEVDYAGEAFEVGFNARYLLDVTGQIGGEMAEFRFAEQSGGARMMDPALVLDPTDAGVQYVLMPLRS